MNTRRLWTKPLSRLNWLLGSFALTAWTLAVADLGAHQPANKMEISSIVFSISAESSQQFGVAFSEQELATQISHTLAAWHYPVNTTAKNRTSYRLQAVIGAMHSDATPLNFLFGSGFQSAQVIPISCQLTNPGSSKPLAKFQTSVVASDWQNTSVAANAAVITAQLSDAVSTVCFNLLDKLALSGSVALTAANMSAIPPSATNE